MKTIDYLRQYNKWRRGDDSIDQPDPKVLGEQIDAAICQLESIEKAKAKFCEEGSDGNIASEMFFILSGGK